MIHVSKHLADAVFTVGSIIFIIGLLPAALDSRTRMPLKTSVPTALVLFTYGVTFYGMGMWFSAISSSVTAGLWTALALAEWHRLYRP